MGAFDDWFDGIAGKLPDGHFLISSINTENAKMISIRLNDERLPADGYCPMTKEGIFIPAIVHAAQGKEGLREHINWSLYRILSEGRITTDELEARLNPNDPRFEQVSMLDGNAPENAEIVAAISNYQEAARIVTAVYGIIHDTYLALVETMDKASDLLTIMAYAEAAMDEKFRASLKNFLLENGFEPSFFDSKSSEALFDRLVEKIGNSLKQMLNPRNKEGTVEGAEAYIFTHENEVALAVSPKGALRGSLPETAYGVAEVILKLVSDHNADQLSRAV